MSEIEGLPPARAYYLSGVGHCNAANIIHQFLADRNTPRTDSTWISLQSILGFAAENTLKAYLATFGVSRGKLSSRNYGHNLRQLHDEAVSRGLEQEGLRINQPELSSAIGRFVELCGADYLSFNYRYIEGSGVEVLTAGEATRTVIRALQCLLDVVRDKLEAEPAAALQQQ